MTVRSRVRMDRAAVDKHLADLRAHRLALLACDPQQWQIMAAIDAMLDRRLELDRPRARGISEHRRVW